MWLVLLLPAATYVTIALHWELQGFKISGDEPHYLILADALTRDHALVVDEAYRRDAETGTIIGPVDWEEHTETGQRGTFSVHAIGLPALIGIPYRWFGLLGVRVVLGIVVGVIPIILAAIARRRGIPHGSSAALALYATWSMPFLDAAGQVYPDLIAGVILLGVVATVTISDNGPLSWRRMLAAGGMLASLPWLHVKHVLLIAVLVISVLARHFRNPYGRPHRAGVLALTGPVVTSLMFLALYHIWAFGRLSGPYTAESAAGAATRQAGMALLGLHFDQLQGVFIQQPFFLIGIVGVVSLLKQDRWLAGTLSVAYLAVTLPNAFHPCVYGCFSVGGRFMWTTAALWCLPIVYLYMALGRWGRALIHVAGILGIALQMALMTTWLRWGPARLYTVMTTDLFDRYSLVTGDWRRWLPTFYDPNRYLTVGPNVAAEVFVGLLLIASIVILGGWRTSLGRRRKATLEILLIAPTLLPTIAILWMSRPLTAPVDFIAGFASAERRPIRAGADAIGLRDERVNDDVRRAVYAYPPSRIIWTVTVPDGAIFRAGIAIDQSAWDRDGDGVVFRVGVSDGERYETLDTRRLDPRANPEDRRWVDVQILLGQYARRKVQFILSTDPGLPGRNDRRNDFAYWGAPTITSTVGR